MRSGTSMDSFSLHLVLEQTIGQVSSVQGMVVPAGLANATKDIVTYAAKALTDPRTENKRLIICPAANKASQNDLITLWEHISGQKISRNVMIAEELDKHIQGVYRCYPLAKVLNNT